METNLFQAEYAQSVGRRRDEFRSLLVELCGVSNFHEVFDEVSRLEVHGRTQELIDAQRAMPPTLRSANEDHLTTVIDSLAQFDDLASRIAAMCLGVNSVPGWSDGDRATMAKMQLFWSAWRLDFAFDLTYVQVQCDLFKQRSTVAGLAEWILQHSADLVGA